MEAFSAARTSPSFDHRDLLVLDSRFADIVGEEPAGQWHHLRTPDQ
jgi:hypothetical protein